MSIKSIAIEPIKGEPSAFTVLIIYYKGKILKTKWLHRAPTTHPCEQKWITLPRGFYAKICSMIDWAYNNEQGVSWPDCDKPPTNKRFNKGAFHHEMRMRTSDGD